MGLGDGGYGMGRGVRPRAFSEEIVRKGSDVDRDRDRAGTTNRDYHGSTAYGYSSTGTTPA